MVPVIVASCRASAYMVVAVWTFGLFGFRVYVGTQFRLFESIPRIAEGPAVLASPVATHGAG